MHDACTLWRLLVLQAYEDQCKDKTDRIIKAGTIEALKANMLRLGNEVRAGNVRRISSKAAPFVDNRSKRLKTLEINSPNEVCGDFVGGKCAPRGCEADSGTGSTYGFDPHRRRRIGY